MTLVNPARLLPRQPAPYRNASTTPQTVFFSTLGNEDDVIGGASAKDEVASACV